MKKILGLALGITMIALTPAVGNAADKIEMNCTKLGLFLIDPAGGKHDFDKPWTGTVVSFIGSKKMMFKATDGNDYSFDLVNGGFYKNGNFIPPVTCKFKNLSLLKQKKKPVSVSVQQRLKALEERVDRLESNETMKFHKKTKSMRD